MASSPAGPLQFLRQEPGPRERQGQRHSHTTMMVSAMLRNSQGDDAGASWIRLLPIDAWHSIGGTRRPPCAKTICELMNAISPHAREAALMRWVTEGLNLKLQLDEKSRVSRRNVGQIQYPGKVPNW